MVDLVKLLTDLKASLDALQVQLADAEAAAKAAYDKGFADGVASVVPQPGPTQADLDAALAKVAELEAALATAKAESEAALAQAVSALKASFKSILDAFEAKENADVDAAKAEVDAL